MNPSKISGYMNHSRIRGWLAPPLPSAYLMLPVVWQRLSVLSLRPLDQKVPILLVVDLKHASLKDTEGIKHSERKKTDKKSEGRLPYNEISRFPHSEPFTPAL